MRFGHDFLDRRVRRGGRPRWGGLTGAVVLGALLTVGSWIANPPPPDPPTKAYDKPAEVCRPPYHAP
jgi:hypothetical protein